MNQTSAVIRRFLNDTLDMVLDGLAAIGLLRGGAVWTRQRWAKRAEAAGIEAEQVRRSVAASHRMCRDCRELVARSQRHCPACGAAMRGIPTGGISRLADWVLPTFGSASTAVLTAIVLLYGVSVMIGGGSLWAPSGEALWRLGAKDGEAILLGGQWWRLFTAVFLHGGLLHLGMNGYSLTMLGPFVESEVGARKFLVVFVLTGALSFLFSSWWNPGMSIGASGAIFGLMGFGVVYGRRSGLARLKGASNYLLQWAMLGALMFFMSGVDHAAHLGGFLSGCMLGLMIDATQPRNALADRLWSLAALAMVLLPIGGFAMAVLAAR